MKRRPKLKLKFKGNLNSKKRVSELTLDARSDVGFPRSTAGPRSSDSYVYITFTLAVLCWVERHPMH